MILSRMPRFTRTQVWQPALLLLVLFSAIPALAQFNGPPATVTGLEINRPVAITTDPSLLYPTPQDSMISVGDSLSIRVFGQPDYTASAIVDVSGDALFPLLEKVHVAGLTVAQAQELIAHRFVVEGIFVDPEVFLSDGPAAGTAAILIGEIRGVVPIVGPRRLLDIIASSGGLQQNTSHVITIHRLGVKEPIVVQLSTDPMEVAKANIPILPGDIIVTSRVGIVYVLGAFKSDATVPLSSYGPLTIMQLASLSGGLSQTGKYSDLRIIRTVGNHRTVSRFDAARILKGKDPDPILQPNDIVYMPGSIWKEILYNGAVGTIFGLFSIGLTLATEHY